MCTIISEDNENKNVYVAYVELTPRKGCQLDPTEICGAFVRLYMPADSNQIAIRAIRSWAQDNYFDLVEIEWCVNKDEVEWENPDDKTANKLAQKALITGRTIASEFHMWGQDEQGE